MNRFFRVARVPRRPPGGSVRGAAAAAFAAAAVFAVDPPIAAAQEAEDSIAGLSGLRLEAYRFWREPDLTLTEIFAVVPLNRLHLTESGEWLESAYSGMLQVRDSTGVVLASHDWRESLRVPLISERTRHRASTTERFSVHLKPGRYQVVLEVTDSASGDTQRVERGVRAPPSRPPHSDLIIASDLSRVEHDSLAPPGSVLRGRLAIIPNFLGAVTPEQAAVGLFAEIYRTSEAPETASVAVLLDGRAGAFHHETARQARVYPAGGGVEAFGLDLAGLPPGPYDLTLQAAFPDDTVNVTHALVMLPPGAGNFEIASSLPYAGLSEEELDGSWAPMVYIATPEDAGTFASLRGAEAKRRFMGRFWERRAAGLGTDATSLRREFEQRVEFADRNFRPPRPGQAGMMGWQTDRGRIWITYGEPAERHVEPQHQHQTNPWEVWRYIEGQAFKYVFWDRSGFGDFVLVHSTNHREPSAPDWERHFTLDAVEFIRTF